MKAYFDGSVLVVDAENDTEANALKAWRSDGPIHGALLINDSYMKDRPPVNAEDKR